MRRQIAFTLLVVLFLGSCTSTRAVADRPPAPDTVTPSLTPAQTPGILPTPTITHIATSPDPITIATLHARSNGTPGTLWLDPDQVTDGKLLFSIAGLSPECHSRDQPIFIKLQYDNLTDEPLILSDSFDIAVNRFLNGGNISILISESDGTPLYTPFDYTVADFFYSPADTRLVITAHSNFEIIRKFHFPLEKVIMETEDDFETNPTTSGNYLLRLLYIGSGDNIWNGILASNQIEICIK